MKSREQLLAKIGFLRLFQKKDPTPKSEKTPKKVNPGQKNHISHTWS